MICICIFLNFIYHLGIVSPQRTESIFGIYKIFFSEELMRILDLQCSQFHYIEVSVPQIRP